MKHGLSGYWSNRSVAWSPPGWYAIRQRKTGRSPNGYLYGNGRKHPHAGWLQTDNDPAGYNSNDRNKKGSYILSAAYHTNSGPVDLCWSLHRSSYLPDHPLQNLSILHKDVHIYNVRTRYRPVYRYYVLYSTSRSGLSMYTWSGFHSARTYSFHLYTHRFQGFQHLFQNSLHYPAKRYTLLIYFPILWMHLVRRSPSL